MAVQHHRQQSRLNIPPALNASNLNALNGQSRFSPSLPNPMMSSFAGPAFSARKSAQAPILAFPYPQSPLLTSTSYSQHRATTSIAAPFMPKSPTPGSYQSLSPFTHNKNLSTSPGGPSQMKSRRTASISIGGPPKALLGGPQRRLSPLPNGNIEAAPVIDLQTPKKKVNVKLPDEGGPIIFDGRAYHVAPWTRAPAIELLMPPLDYLDALNISTSEDFCMSATADAAQTDVDVLLPPQEAWAIWRRSIVEERLSKIDFESSDASQEYDDASEIMQRPNRQNSISSPADPALLSFKLNKLQRDLDEYSRRSPQVPSISAGLQEKEEPWLFSTREPVPQKPFSVSPLDEHGLSHVRAPTARAPFQGSTILSEGSVGSGESRPLSRRDFARGFGVDIVEEEEEGDEDDAFEPHAMPLFGFVGDQREGKFVHPLDSLGDSRDLEDSETGGKTVGPSRIHSRHISHASGTQLELHADITHADLLEGADKRGPPGVQKNVSEDTGDWTGSEDMQNGEEEKSDGEYSNPSDEEKMRQMRIHARMARLSRGTEEIPRRLPKFPTPPNDSTLPQAAGGKLDDEVLSNPSDEDWINGNDSAAAIASRSSRPLPPIPDSHSRNASKPDLEGFQALRSPGGDKDTVSLLSLQHGRSSSSAFPKRDSLNPFAKPFAFGGRLADDHAFHLRASSGGLALNAAAQVFTPGAFSFQPPPGLPSFTFPDDLIDHDPNMASSFRREEQGREKRQRVAKTAEPVIQMHSMSDAKENVLGNVLKSSHIAVQKEQHSSLVSALNVAAKTFMPSVALHSVPAPSVGNDAGNSLSYDRKIENLPSTRHDTSPPPQLKSNHPDKFEEFVPSATVSAARSAVEPQHDALSAGHRANHEADPSLKQSDSERRQSLDDLHVPAISGRRAVTPLDVAQGSPAEGREHPPPASPDAKSQLVTGSNDVIGDGRIDKIYDTKLFHDEQNIEDLLDDKLDLLRRDLVGALRGNEMPLLHAQTLHEFAVTLAALLSERLDLRSGTHSVKLGPTRNGTEPHTAIGTKHGPSVPSTVGDGQSDFPPEVPDETTNQQQVSSSLIAHELVSRMDSLERALKRSYSEEQKILLHDILTGLAPRLDTIQAGSLNPDVITAKLSSAVRPQIRELIDLASDKQETATLIVHSLGPLLHEVATSQRDRLVDDLTSSLSGQISVLNKLEAERLNEQLSDLIRDRLEDRLHVEREHELQITSEMLDRAMQSLQPWFKETQDALAAVSRDVACNMDVTSHLDARYEVMTSKINDSVATLAPTMRALEKEIHTMLTGALERLTFDKSILGAIDTFKSVIQGLADNYGDVASRIAEISRLHDNSFKDVASLPSAVAAVAEALGATRQELEAIKLSSAQILSRTDLAATNTILQEQVRDAEAVAARLSNEMDAALENSSKLNRRLKSLSVEVQQRDAQLAINATELQDFRERNVDLNQALEKTLARASALDEGILTRGQQIEELEANNQRLSSENGKRESNMRSLEQQLEWANRAKHDRDTEIKQLRDERSNLLNQQSQWDNLQKATKQLDLLMHLVERHDSTEREDFNRLRDESKVLEGEHAALQRRFREQQSKLAIVERSFEEARQNLTQIQQQNVDLECSVKKRETDMESIQLRVTEMEGSLEEAESRFMQLNSEKELAVAQANAKLEQLQKELDVHKTDAKTCSGLEVGSGVPVQAWRNSISNGATAASQSRASTPTPTNSAFKEHHSSAVAAGEGDNKYPMTSTWDSMHAPKTGTLRLNELGHPRLQAQNSSYRDHVGTTERKSASSPTLSVMSCAPTLQEDGWWS